MKKLLIYFFLLVPFLANAQWKPGGTPQAIFTGNGQLRFQFLPNGYIYTYTKGQIDSIKASLPVGGVSSVFGRTGGITALTGDYAAFYPTFTYFNSNIGTAAAASIATKAPTALVNGKVDSSRLYGSVLPLYTTLNYFNSNIGTAATTALALKAGLLSNNVFSGTNRFNLGTNVPYGEGYQWSNTAGTAAITLKLDNQVVGNRNVIFPSLADTVADRSWAYGRLATRADTAALNRKGAIQSQYTTTPGQKRVYSRSAYTTSGNLVTNPAFASGTTGYTPFFLTDGGGNNLYTTISYGGKTWLRLNSSTSGSTSNTGYMQFTVNVPSGQENSIMEVSFLVNGIFNGATVGGEDWENMGMNIDSLKSERIYYYFNPNGATSFTVNLNRSYNGGLEPGAHTDYTEVLVRQATYTMSDIAKQLPSTGGAIQLARWLLAWNEPQQEKILSNYRKMGGMVRVWLAADKFATFTTKAAVKRSNISSIYFTTAYNNYTTESVPTATLNSSMTYYLDWFFNKCREYGIKLHVCLGSGLAGQNTPATYEFIDSDTQMQTGFVNLYSTIATRYKDYENIVSYELMNEGWAAWRFNYSGLASTTPLSKRSFTFAGYKNFERAAYTALKPIIGSRPIVLNEGNVPPGQYFASDDICDWYTPSLYPAAITVSVSTGITASVITPTRGIGQILSTAANGYSLIAHSESGNTLPTGLVEGTRYYIVNLTTNTLQLSATSGGSPISLSGGSGSIYLYSDNGTAVSYSDYILQKWSYDPKFVYLAEVGATVAGSLNLYRTPSINALLIPEVVKRQQKYGIASSLWFDEANLFFDLTTLAFNVAGTALVSSSTSANISYGLPVELTTLNNVSIIPANGITGVTSSLGTGRQGITVSLGDILPTSTTITSTTKGNTVSNGGTLNTKQLYNSFTTTSSVSNAQVLFDRFALTPNLGNGFQSQIISPGSLSANVVSTLPSVAGVLANISDITTSRINALYGYTPANGVNYLTINNPAFTGTLTGPTANINGGTYGFNFRTYTGGGNKWSIYPSNVTPGLSNYVFMHSAAAETEINSPTNVILEVGGATKVSVTSTGAAVTGLLSATAISSGGPINLRSYTVSGLPAGTIGDTAYVTDALAPSYLVAVTGGGSVKTPVFFDGTNWVAH